jgi:hypothetical protein
MKIRTASRLLLALSITAVLALAARNVAAQVSATSAAQTAPLPLSYGVSQIIQLSQANVSEGTIVNYIQNSGSSYGLDANQIVYLKQQGVSDAVINTMLNQPRPAAPPANYSTAGSAPTAIVVTQPTVTYAPAPSSTVYVIPDTQTYSYYTYGYRPYGPRYYYPGYSPVYYGGCYPSLSFSIGIGGGYRGGYNYGGWSGGARGGYHGGGGWHR